MALKLLEANITLDLYDHDGTRPQIKSIALDDNTRYVFAKLTYKQELYDIGSDATVKLIIIRPDKVGAQIAGEAKEIRIGQADESIVAVYGAYAELDQPAIAVAGTLLGQFIITSGDQILRSQIFAVNNGQALDADTWAGDYDGYNLDELVEKVDAAVDKVDGMEEDVSELKSGLSEILEPYNLYDPSDTFIQTNASGASKNGYTINADGTITGTRTNGNYGSLFLVNENKTLKAGEYTLSCKITLNEGATGNNRVIATRIGRATSNKMVPMTTERGGSTNITTSDFVGWIKATFTLSTDETFAFMVLPNDTALASGSKPYVISDLQIEHGNVMRDYSSNNNSSIDLYARWNEKLLQKAINSYDIVLRNNVGFIYTTSSARHSFTVIENGGLSVFVGGKLNFRILDSSGSAMYVQKTWEEISASISDDITIDGDTATIVISRYSQTLVYDISDGQLHIVNSSAAIGFSKNYLPLVQNAYSLPIGGFIVEEYYHRLVDDMQNDTTLTASDIFNAEPFTGTYDWQTPVVSYGALFKGKSNVESFAFFTDPHVMGFGDSNRNETRMENYLKRVQKVYNSTPCSFIVCGGDLLNNATTMDEACYRLGYIKGIFKHLLDGCKLVIGNHDTNYQGKLDSESENYTGRLTDATLASILYRDTDTKKAYYSFDGANSKCYVLDTGIEHSSMLAYDWEQVDWLANKLKTDDADHSIIFLHIIVSSDTVQTNASNFGSLVEAYNNHAAITLNGVTYNFTACSGRVEFWVAGHTHRDSNGTLGGIPYFITASNSFNSDVPLIDLVLTDYDNNVVKIIRAGGTGEDRTIQLT